VGTALTRLVQWSAHQYSARARRRRSAMFHALMQPAPGDRILDVGSEDGSHIAQVVGTGFDVHIADIDPEALERGRKRYGFAPVLIGEDARLPFDDRAYDIVFCSSVIEHVTVDKAAVRSFSSKRPFERAALDRQRRFAREIRRVGKGYFVQTPYRYFPIESHTWFPAFIVFLPRTLQVRLIEALNRVWPKKTSPDFPLLTRAQMAELFPDATIVFERSLGLPKSMIAVRRYR
jgi:Methyltransferase domain